MGHRRRRLMTRRTALPMPILITKDGDRMRTPRHSVALCSMTRERRWWMVKFANQGATTSSAITNIGMSVSVAVLMEVWQGRGRESRGTLEPINATNSITFDSIKKRERDRVGEREERVRKKRSEDNNRKQEGRNTVGECYRIASYAVK